MPTGTGVSYQPGVNGNLTGWVTISVPTAPSVASVRPVRAPGRRAQSDHHWQSPQQHHGGHLRGTPATNVVVVSDTTLTARTPAHGAGTVDVLVTTSVDTSAAVAAARYSYVRAPVITSVSPRRGPTAGGKTVTVLGSNLKGATRVKFGTKSGKLLTVSATKVTVRAPAHAAGKVDIRVTTPGGTSAKVKGDRFTYC